MRPLLHQFDHQITKNIQQWPEWVQPIMLFASFVGQPVFTVGIGIIIIATAWMGSNLHLAVSGAIVLATISIGAVIKLILGRERPLTDYVLALRFDLSSFPSGHTVGSTIAYGLSAYLLWYFFPMPWGYIISAVLVLLIVIVGLSRVYLGAHYPSDVVAGWLLGGFALAIIIFVVQPKL